MLKWAVAAALSVLWLALLHDFPVRWVNYRDPGYGRLSGGGGFALMMEGVFLLMGRLTGCGLGAVVSDADPREKVDKVRRALQGIVLPLIAAAIIGAVLYMNAIMPAWDEIYWQTYG